ncbi:MAG: SEC-C metal-binding domain-containing protein, partial [Treponema sp.]|nr:SEC-C metal-binding domain-containing protein [Treponema sp.]MCL2237961.1 SEC-C metal-binding domain-containing protein [Treponema sp.]
KNLMSRIGMPTGEAIFHPMLNKSIEGAQKKVEERNFEIRKHLLEYDDVLNQQRKFIYEQRDAILVDTGLRKRVNEATDDIVGDYIESYNQTARNDQDEALKDLTEQLRAKFGFVLNTEDDRELKNPETLEKRIIEELEKELADKEALIGTEYMNLIIRDNYLNSIDRKWLDHLENMEALREAVYLRHYAQKNPLTEYKVEGFQIFEKMIEEIRQEIASRLHLIRIQISGDNQRRPLSRSIGANANASHSSIGSFDGGSLGAAPTQQQQASSAMNRASRPEAATVVRSQPKVGRNDPCPCGSGKKYKHCHGK